MVPRNGGSHSETRWQGWTQTVMNISTFPRSGGSIFIGFPKVDAGVTYRTTFTELYSAGRMTMGRIP